MQDYLYKGIIGQDNNKQGKDGGAKNKDGQDVELG